MLFGCLNADLKLGILIFYHTAGVVSSFMSMSILMMLKGGEEEDDKKKKGYTNIL